MIIAALACCILLAGAATSADAQKRRPTTGKKGATKKTDSSKASVVKDNAEKVKNQIRNISQFLYILGSSSELVKSVDADARSGKLSNDARKQGDAGKQGIVLTIRTFKNAMLKLEDDFRADQALRPYLLQITGVGELAGTAEDQAAAGNYDRASRSLLDVIGQLSDTLEAMP